MKLIHSNRRVPKEVDADPIVAFRAPGRSSWLVKSLFGLVAGAVFVLAALNATDASTPPEAGSCAARCRSGGFGVPDLVLVALIVGTALYGIQRWRVTEVRIYADELVRRRPFSTQRYRFREITNAYLRPVRRLEKTRAVPTLVTRDGRLIALVELAEGWRVPFTRAAPSQGAIDVVDAIRLRIGNPDPLPPPPSPSAAESAPASLVSGWFLAIAGGIVALVVLGLLVIVAVIPFISTSASVDPAKVPTGRVYVGYVDSTGRVSYSVDCPPPTESAFGSDPLCQPDGHDQLVTSAIGVPVCIAVLVAGGFAARWERRRRPSRKVGASAPPALPAPRKRRVRRGRGGLRA